MARRQWSDGQELVWPDMNAIASALEIEIFDRIIYELMGRQQNVVFGNSFSVTYVNATTVAVGIGNGVYYDNTQSDPEPMTRQLHVASSTNKTLAAADGSNNRIDLICIAPALVTNITGNRNTKDPNTGLVTSVSQNLEADWISTLSVVTGTPSGSPVAPSIPAGTLCLAQVLVVATSGLANQAGITDERPVYLKSANPVTAVTATYAALITDETITGNASGGSFTITLPPAASAFNATTTNGKKYTIVNIGATGTLTIAGNGSEKISDSNTQALANQYSSITVQSNGTQWYMI